MPTILTGCNSKDGRSYDKNSFGPVATVYGGLKKAKLKPIKLANEFCLRLGGSVFTSKSRTCLHPQNPVDTGIAMFHQPAINSQAELSVRWNQDSGF